MPIILNYIKESTMNQIFLIIVSLGLIAANPNSELSLSDFGKSISEYINGYGYPFQEHRTITKDGYILTLWRIPCRNHTKDKCTPVYFQHGLEDTGFSFLFQSIEENLPIKLYNLGYDIWIGNIRGNRFSLGHTHLNSKDKRGPYWDFTYDEMGKYDLPAIANHIKATTRARRIKYICHSQGCAMLVALGSLDPQYVQSIIDSTVAFAPAVYIQYHNSLLVKLTLWSQFAYIYSSTGLKTVLSSDICYTAVKYLGYFFPRIFMSVLYLILGPVDKVSLAIDRLPVLAAYLPGGTSVLNMIHFTQAAKSSVFQMFDYGKEGNLKHYGRETPPPYNIDNWQQINMRWRIVYGEKDPFIPKPAIMELVKRIDRNGNIEMQGIKDGNHFDIFGGTYASKLIYPQIIDFLERSNNSNA